MHRTLALICILSMAAPLSAQTSYPMITHAHPVAIQRGKTVEIAVDGQQNFLGAYQTLIEGRGVSAEIVPQPEPKPVPPATRPLVRSVRLKVTASADALPGVREFRIATSMSLSSVGQIVVVDDPVVVETANNNTPQTATAAAVPCVVCGKIEALEDVDYIKFTAKAGQVLTFEVHCARIQDKIHDLQKHADPMLTLFDAGGNELAGNDDFYFADSLLTYRIEKDGEYYIQLRDAKYDGDPRWVYALAITDRPYASHVHPLAVNPGKVVEVEPVGSARLTQFKGQVKVPANALPGVTLLPVEVGGKATNPVPLFVTALPVQVEEEGNDTPQSANRLHVPACMCGRMNARRDLDHYVFTAKRGQAIRFEVQARRFGTPLISGLDANLDVMDLTGKILASADDISPAIKDAQLIFTPPADGDYVVRVRDLFSKGGEQFVYALEAEPTAPDFTLRCDGDKAMLGPGASMAWYVHVTRLHGFTGPVSVSVRGLPEGVTASPLVIPPSMAQGVLVLTATAGVKPSAVNIEVIGTAASKDADGKESTLTRRATPNQEVYFPGGGRGRFDVNLHTVSITDPSDIELVEVTPNRISLKPGEEVKLTVKVKRRADYTGPVQLDIRLRHLAGVFGDPLPPGVTIVEGKSKTLLGSASEGHIVLRAASNAAPVEDVPISILAQVSINFVVKVSYSSAALMVTVGK
jgi:hypothetical protein